jgi:hypothetical protein
MMTENYFILHTDFIQQIFFTHPLTDARAGVHACVCVCVCISFCLIKLNFHQAVQETFWEITGVIKTAVFGT